MIVIDVSLEVWRGSDVTKLVSNAYSRKPAVDFLDAPAKLTPRQCVFYHNLLLLAQTLKSPLIPVDFNILGVPKFLDRGCIKIAEHSNFIRPLHDGEDGVVDFIQLSFDILGEREALPI